MKRVIAAVVAGMMMVGCGTILPPTRSQKDAVVAESRAQYSAALAQQRALSDAQWAVKHEVWARERAEKEAVLPGSTWRYQANDFGGELMQKSGVRIAGNGWPKDPKVCNYYYLLVKPIFELRNQGMTSLEVYNALKDYDFPHKELRPMLPWAISTAYTLKQYYGRYTEKGWQVKCVSRYFPIEPDFYIKVY